MRHVRNELFNYYFGNRTHGLEFSQAHSWRPRKNIKNILRCHFLINRSQKYRSALEILCLTVFDFNNWFGQRRGSVPVLITVINNWEPRKMLLLYFPGVLTSDMHFMMFIGRKIEIFLF